MNICEDSVKDWNIYNRKLQIVGWGGRGAVGKPQLRNSIFIEGKVQEYISSYLDLDHFITVAPGQQKGLEIVQYHSFKIFFKC